MRFRDHLRQARHGALVAPKWGCVTAESPSGGQREDGTLIVLPSGDQANPPSQQRYHCFHRSGTVWGFLPEDPTPGQVSDWWQCPQVCPPRSSHCGHSVFAIQTGICLRFGGGWRVGVLPLGCKDPDLSVPVLQGESTSEQTSERENLSHERRFLGSAFESFYSGCLDALLPALINVSGGKLPLVPHSPSKEGKEAV